MGALLGILVNLLIFCLLAGLVLMVIRWAVGYLSLPDIIVKVAVVIVVIFALLWLIGAFTGSAPYIYKFR